MLMVVFPPTPESISLVEKTFPAGLPLSFEASRAHTHCQQQENETEQNPEMEASQNRK
jgi:hypothetical protein